MPHDMELVEQNRGLRRMSCCRYPKRLPHIHHREPNAGALLLAQPGIELAHACLRAVLAAKPDRAPAQQIAHHDPIGVTLRIAISSMPITRGEGVPARLSWA